MRLCGITFHWPQAALGAVLVASLGAWLVGTLGHLEAANAEVQRGRTMYLSGTDDSAPLKAHMAHQPDSLPAMAVRCVNCHDRSGVRGEFRAQVLSPEILVAMTSRRGGPATRFDAPSMCKLLKTGIDPAWILISQSMPRYDLSHEQCQSLWKFLESATS